MPSPSVPPGGKDRRQPSTKPTALWWVLGVLTLLAIGQAYFLAPQGRQVSYSEFKGLVRSGQVAEVAVGDTIIHGTMKKAENGIPGTVAPVEEVQLYIRDAGGNRVDVSLQELIDRKMGAKIARADLFISKTRDGELLITSRQDGTIRMLVPDSGTTPSKR